MKFIKNKYFKFFFVFLCVFAAHDVIDASTATTTCTYSISNMVSADGSKSYSNLTVVHPNSASSTLSTGPVNLQYEGQKFILSYQFDNDNPRYVDADENAWYMYDFSMWNGIELKYHETIGLDEWISESCVDTVFIFYIDDLSDAVIARTEETNANWYLTGNIKTAVATLTGSSQSNTGAAIGAIIGNENADDTGTNNNTGTDNNTGTNNNNGTGGNTTGTQNTTVTQTTCVYEIPEQYIGDGPLNHIDIVYKNTGNNVNYILDYNQYIGYYYSNYDNTKLYNNGDYSAGYHTFITHEQWVEAGCFDSIIVYYNPISPISGYTYGISNAGDASQARYFGSGTTIRTYFLERSSSNVVNDNDSDGTNDDDDNDGPDCIQHGITFRNEDGELVATQVVCHGDRITEPNARELGIPLNRDGDALCWYYEPNQTCWNFNEPVTTDMGLSVAYDSQVGFLGNIENRYILCNNTQIPYGLPYIVSKLINLFKVVVPIVLILMGMIDFAKAVATSDEKQMKEAQNKLIRRTIAGVAVFFVVAVVQFVFREILVEENETTNSVTNCIHCFLSNDCETHIYEED